MGFASPITTNMTGASDQNINAFGNMPRRSFEGHEHLSQDTKNIIMQNLIENKNSFMRRQSILIRQISHLEKWKIKATQKLSPGGAGNQVMGSLLKTTKDIENEKLKKLLLETDFLN